VSVVIPESEYNRMRSEVKARETKGSLFCLCDWVCVVGERCVTVRVKRNYGEKTETKYVPGLWKCIKCGAHETHFGNANMPTEACFIATAAYGNPLASQLDVFRHFRDQSLPTLLVELYYRVSPPLASIINKREKLRLITRSFLEPIVRLLQRKWGLEASAHSGKESFSVNPQNSFSFQRGLRRENPDEEA